MNEFDKFSQAQETKLRQRALWAAVLLTLLEGFFSAFAIYQLALVNFVPIYAVAFVITAAVFAAFLLTIAGTIFIIRRQVMLGLNLVYFSGFLPALTISLLFVGRGITAAFTIGIISLLVLFFVYPSNKQQTPLLALAALVVVVTLVEFINPAYRVNLAIPTQVGPGAGIIFVLFFATLLIRQRWDRFNLRAKLIFAVALIPIILILILTYGAVNNIRHQVDVDEEKQLASLYTNYNNYVSTLEDTAASLALSIADRQDIIELYKEKDRQGLLNLLTPLFNKLKQDYKIVHLYIENPDGTVFVRVHNPTNYGDDVTYRRTAAATLNTHQTIAGVEIGPSRLGIRGVTPLYDGDQFIGMLEVGIDYDEQFIQDLEAATSAQYSMWVTNEAAAPAGLTAPENSPVAPLPDLFFYASTYSGTLNIPSEIYQQVLDSGEPAPIQHATDGESELAVMVAPMLGYGGRTIGILEIISNREQIQADIQSDTRNLMIIAGFAAIGSLALMWLISQAIILSPIKQLTEVSQKQLGGELSARVKTSGQDEFSQLGNTLNTLSENMQGLIAELEDRVLERTEELEAANVRTEHRAEQLEALAQVAKASASIQELNELLPRITQLISEHFGFYHAGIFLLDSAKQFAYLTAANSEGGKKMLARSHRLQVGSQSIVGFVTNTGLPRIALDVGSDAIHFDNPDLPETRSEMALPLIAGADTIGALDVQSTEAHAFTEEDIEVLSTLADQIAVAIENARLFEETRRLLSESQAAFGENLMVTWKQMVESRKNIRYDFKGINIQPVSEPLTLPEIEEANQTGKIVLHGLNQDNSHAAIAIPIKVRGKVIGVLNARLPENKDWDLDEVDISEAIAERLGIAIEGAILLEESQRRAAMESTIGQISSKIGESAEIEKIMQIAVSELRQALGASEVVLKIGDDEG